MNIDIHGWDWFILAIYALVLFVDGLFHREKKKFLETHHDFFKHAFFISLWLVVLYLAGTFS